jgi:hypothetical protein
MRILSEIIQIRILLHVPILDKACCAKSWREMLVRDGSATLCPPRTNSSTYKLQVVAEKQRAMNIYTFTHTYSHTYTLTHLTNRLRCKHRHANTASEQSPPCPREAACTVSTAINKTSCNKPLPQTQNDSDRSPNGNQHGLWGLRRLFQIPYGSSSPPNPD